MRSLLALLAIALLCLDALACGSAGHQAGSASHEPSTTATTGTNAAATGTTSSASSLQADADRDNDGGPGDDKNNNSVMDYGHAASATDARAITALLTGYYHAAVAEDGTKACSLLYSSLAEGVPEDYGQSPPGPSYLVANTCPAVLTLLFKHFHKQIATELPVMRVARVRLKQHHGWAVLSFGTMPERQISFSREGHAWKLGALLDTELP